MIEPSAAISVVTAMYNNELRIQLLRLGKRELNIGSILIQLENTEKNFHIFIQLR